MGLRDLLLVKQRFFSLRWLRPGWMIITVVCMGTSGCLGKFDDKRPEVVINYTPPHIQPITVSGQDLIIDHPFPKKYMGFRAGGGNISPEISWAPVTDAKSYSIIISDAASPPLIYWVLVNIPYNIFSIRAGASPRHLPKGSMEMPNSINPSGRYAGPVPASINMRRKKEKQRHHFRRFDLHPTTEKNDEQNLDDVGHGTIRINVYASNMESIPTLTVESMLNALQNTLIARGKITVDIPS